MAKNTGETNLPDRIQGTEYRRNSPARQDPGTDYLRNSPAKQDTWHRIWEKLTYQT